MSDDDDKVGYRKPPTGTRFKPGQSGNPKGRKKGTKNFATAIRAEFAKTVMVTENGKQKRMSKGDALTTSLVNKALNGDTKMVPFLLKELRDDEPIPQGQAADSCVERPEDWPVMAEIVRRIRLMEEDPPPDTAEQTQQQTPKQPTQKEE